MMQREADHFGRNVFDRAFQVVVARVGGRLHRRNARLKQTIETGDLLIEVRHYRLAHQSAHDSLLAHHCRSTPPQVSRAKQQSCGPRDKPLRASAKSSESEGRGAYESRPLGVAEHAAENRIDVREMIIEIEVLAEFFFAQVLAHVFVGLQ